MPNVRKWRCTDLGVYHQLRLNKVPLKLLANGCQSVRSRCHVEGVVKPLLIWQLLLRKRTCVLAHLELRTEFASWDGKSR